MTAEEVLRPHKAIIRQWWLVENKTGKQVSRKLAAMGVKAS